MKNFTYLLFLVCFSFGLNAQVYFSDDFSDLDISDWTIYDADGDSYSWDVGDWSFDGTLPEFSESLFSRSWISGVGGLNPNNYAVSPAIDLSGASTGLQLEYTYGTPQAAPYHPETYSVYVTTSNSLSALQSATAVHTETLSNPSSSQVNVINLDAYIGQTIYISFRHHDTFDENVMVIDDVTVSVPLSLDASLVDVSLNRYSLTSVDNQLTLEVNNNGSTPITSLELNWSDGTTDHIQTVPVTISPGETLSVDHPTPVNYSSVEEKNINVTITSVNGSSDGDASNNNSGALFNTLSQLGTTRVVIEEQTGTWCGWCPRGTVGMSYMGTNYPDTAILIAVHGGDPMEYSPYISGINNIIGSGYPNAVINRKIESDPGSVSLEPAYNSEINNIVPVDLNSTATLDGSTLEVNASATFYSNFSNANYRLGVIIKEDNVTGTSSGYAHVNYYSGGGNGPMGGYENLPDPVPASDMVYDLVGRALLGGFDGAPGSVPSSISDGQVVNHMFTYDIPVTIDQNYMSVVVVLIDGNDGSIVSGFEQTLGEVLSIQENNSIDGVAVYPNPVNNVLKINLQQPSGKYSVAVFDVLGRQVMTSSFNESHTLELDVNNLAKGQYILKLTNKDNSYVTKFVKE